MSKCQYCNLNPCTSKCQEEVELPRAHIHCPICEGWRVKGERNCRNCTANRLSGINFDRNARWNAEIAAEKEKLEAKKAAKAAKVAEQAVARKERERVRREKAKASSAKRDKSPKRGEPGDNFFDRLVVLQEANGPAIEDMPTQPASPETGELQESQLIEFAVEPQ